MALAAGIGALLTVVLLGLVYLHRTRRTALLTRAGGRLGRATGVPDWVALPAVLTTVALLGMLGDIALHIGVGRDEGPLANPAHYLILFGLFGVFAVSADLIAYVQVGAVATGHVAGVVLAHERALRLAPRASATDQLPLVVVMVLFTVGGLGLLFGF